MTFKRTLGVAALLVTAVAFAQPQPAKPAPATPAPSTTAPTGGATVTPLPAPAPAPTVSLTDAHALAKWGDAKAGQVKAAACGACHGMDGNSSDAQYPKLAAQQERYIARQLALFKTGERENAIMVGFASSLSPQDMRDVGAYFASQKVVPGVADDTVIKDGVYQGKKFYEVGQMIYRGGDAARNVPACMACHGPTGAGNPGPAYPNLGGQHAKYVADKLTAFRGGLVLGQKGYANAVMSQVTHNLTDQEIQALATYVEGLHASSADAPAATVATAAPTAAAPSAAAASPAPASTPAQPAKK
jgi:cytochrome c553